MCKAGGFPLQKRISHHPAIFESISSEKHARSISLQFNETAITHVLGLCFNISADAFHFSITSSIPTAITKRTILSIIAKVFDPLGLLAPVTITAKIFIQKLWSLKLGWNDPLPLLTSKKWTQFTNLFQDIPKLKFPRWISLTSEHDFEIHGFSDASQRAICATL